MKIIAVTEKGKTNEIITFALDRAYFSCDWLCDLRFDSCKLGGRMMDVYTATEQAYKNGYEKGYAAGKKDATDNNVGYKWIPVNEWLPDAGQYVLVFDAREDYIGMWELWDCAWRDASYQIWGLNEVTHWMPLPEPPKEGK